MPRSRVYLRRPALTDEVEFVASARASRRLHHPWTKAPVTPEAFRGFVERVDRLPNRVFLVCRRDDDRIAGVVVVSNIILGSFCSAFLGYFAFAGHEGQGLMREGLKAVIRHAFTELKLRRLEANIQPGNTRSIELVKACGFRQEGFSPRYLKVGGRWRDHERWAILED